MATTDTLQIGALAMGLLGGLAFFLLGLEYLTDALKIVAGSGMRRILGQLTTNRFKGALAGAGATAVIQSSSVTTVLLVGFISAGLLTLGQCVPVIMGANIGTTITAQVIAFKVTRYALVLVAIGYAVTFLFRDQKRAQYGNIILGLGLIFFGMEVMSGATRPLRSYAPFIDLMRRMEGPLPGILVGAVFTGLVQSSSATTAVIIVMAGQGLISLEGGIALAFGANIGTCITAVLATVGKPREALQAAAVHVLFNVVGVLLWLGFIDELAALVRVVSPARPDLTGAARRAIETPRQIANAHTVFNVANTLLLIWFATPLAWLARRLVPPESAVPERLEATHLHDILLETPELALEFTRLELCRLGRFTQQMVEKALPTIFEGNRADLRALERMDDEVDALHAVLVRYLGQMTQTEILEEHSRRMRAYLTIANHFENIGDMIETNIVQAGMHKRDHGIEISAGTQAVLSELYGSVSWSVAQVVQALAEQNVERAQAVISAKQRVTRLADEATGHLGTRLISAAPNRLALFRMESELVEYLKRVYYFAKRIAKEISDLEQSEVPPAPPDTESRARRGSRPSVGTGESEQTEPPKGADGPKCRN